MQAPGAAPPGGHWPFVGLSTELLSLKRLATIYGDGRMGAPALLHSMAVSQESGSEGLRTIQHNKTMLVRTR